MTVSARTVPYPCRTVFTLLQYSIYYGLARLDQPVVRGHGDDLYCLHVTEILPYLLGPPGHILLPVYTQHHSLVENVGIFD